MYGSQDKWETIVKDKESVLKTKKDAGMGKYSLEIHTT